MKSLAFHCLRSLISLSSWVFLIQNPYTRTYFTYKYFISLSSRPPYVVMVTEASSYLSRTTHAGLQGFRFGLMDFPLMVDFEFFWVDFLFDFNWFLVFRWFLLVVVVVVGWCWVWERERENKILIYIATITVFVWPL